MPPTRQSVRALLSRNQLTNLYQGGRTRAGADNPVIALGAGYVPIIQEGLNARLSPQGPYGPFTQNIAHQYGAGGRMQLRGGYFDSSGNPHQGWQSGPTGATNIWFLNLNTNRLTQGDLQHQAVINIRRLYSRLGMAERFNNDEMNQAIMEAQNFAIQNGQESIFGQLNPHNTETIDIGRLAANQAFSPSSRSQWRNLNDAINLIPDDEIGDGGTLPYPNVKSMLARALIADNDRSLFMTGADSSTANAESVEQQERQTLAALYAEYNYHAAQYTNSLLSFLNERMREGINRMDPNFSVTQRAGDEVAISQTAVMPEEHAAVIVGAGDTGESIAPAIGNTGSMDFAINFMGQIHTGDISNRGIWEEYQHGLSRGAIASKQQIRDMIEAQGGDATLEGRGTIHEMIYNYYRNDALPDWNNSLREIKRQASRTYSIAQRALSPEQMRNPLGRSTNPSMGVSRRGMHRRPGQGVMNSPLHELSTSTNAMLRHIPALSNQVAQHEGIEESVAFVNHMMGTWYQHLGHAFHSLTVREKPRVTSTAFFQQFTEGANKYLFNIPAFTRDHLVVQDGYALLNLLQNAGYIRQNQVDDTVFKMKAAELARRTKGAGTNITIGANNAIGSNGVINSNRGRATLSINIPADYEQTIIDNILTQIEPPKLVGQHGGPPPRERRLLNTVAGALGNQTGFNRQLWITQTRMMRDGRYWPHLATMWAAPYMARLRRS
tara:strand:- start:37 stop:2202 length:2166 start_codon:yes stop_codon:yes gene_type:complete